MRTSSSINCFFDGSFTVPVAEQIRRMYDAGFRVLDMNFWDWCHDARSPFVAEGWQRWVGEVGETAARLGVTFTQAHAHVYNFFAEPEAAFKRELLARSLEGAARLGIPWVTYHLSAKPEAGYLASVSENVEYFKPLVALAERLGSGIALENMRSDRGGPVDAAGLAEVIERLGSPRVGVCWDTGHAYLAGVDQPANIRALGARLKALHVQDNDGREDWHMPPYFGSIDWPALMAALREIGYAGDFTFEAHMIVRRVPDGARANAARLMYNIGEELTRA